MFERFTDRARRVVVLAQEEARMLHHGYIGTEHLLLGLISEGSGVGAKALEALGVELVRARGAIEGIIGQGGDEVPPGHIPFTPRAKKVMELSLREALTLGHNYIGTEHILLGLVREEEGVGAQVLIRSGVTVGAVRTKVIELLQGFTATAAGPPRQRIVDAAIERFDRLSPGMRAAIEAAAGYASAEAAIGSQHLLAVFAEWDDLTANAVLRAGGFDTSRLESAIADWSVAGTRDETPSEWGMRVTEIETTDEGVLIALRDEELQARIKSAIDAGHGPSVQAMIGEALKQLASKLPPADPSVGEAGDAPKAAAAGGEEDGDEQDRSDENDGGT
jgi:ATP-dependent Clp protease ATP-binding subunit ClpA